MLGTVESIRESLLKGSRFVSFRYTSKDTGETAMYTLLLGVNIVKAYRRDLKILEKLPALNLVEKQAKLEMLESIRESLSKGLGHNHLYNLAGLYYPICPGVRLNQVTNALNLYGFVICKKVITPGNKKPCKHSAKSLAKKKFKKYLKSSRFRCFILEPDQLTRLKINGKILEL